MRWEDADLHALYQLQNRMHLYTGGEEEESPERVGKSQTCRWQGADSAQGKVRRRSRESIRQDGEPAQAIG